MIIYFRFTLPLLHINILNMFATAIPLFITSIRISLFVSSHQRVHRIGQTSQTYLHRYIMTGTIEAKIDKLRVERQENHFEDDLLEQRKHGIRAGGIDGGLDLSELDQLFSHATT